jgi:uncharacterized protein (TIRG00374 family)
MKKKTKSFWSLGLRLLVTFGIGIFFYYNTKWEQFGMLLSEAKLGWVGMAFFCYGMTTLLSICRWHILLQACSTTVSWGRTMQLTMVGLFCNSFLPGALGGDLVKAVYIAREVPAQKPAAIMSIVMERLLGFVAMFFVSTALILTRWNALTGEYATRYAVYFYFGFFALVFLILGIGTFGNLEKYFPVLEKIPFRRTLREAGQAYQMFLRRPSCFWGGLLLSALAHFGLMGTFYSISLALGMGVNFWDLAAVLPLVGLVTLIPITINGLGLREMAFQHFLIFAGMTDTSSLALSLGGAGVIQMWGLVGGIIYFRFKSKGVVVTEADLEETKVSPVGR